jgi:2,4-dienoyl-CoA reductase-like NADH-dependent reductase (Old Yellow Enzyme family)
MVMAPLTRMRAGPGRVPTALIAEAVAFGRLFIANPDLPERFRLHAPLNPLDATTLSGGVAKGYTDYPAMGPQLAQS